MSGKPETMRRLYGPKIARDEAICARRREGATIKVIAREFGLSPARVHQVIDPRVVARRERHKVAWGLA